MPVVTDRALPGWAALAVAAAGGVASAGQTAANGELGVRLGSAPVAALTNVLVGSVIIVVGAVVLPGLRAGFAALRVSRPPWWAYLGGAGGAFFVAGAAVAAPVIGVAVFTIAQVTGGAIGGLAVDRVHGARLPVSGPRVAGALVGVGAVAVAQIGKPVGELALGMLALAVGAGLAVAAQATLNGRIALAGSPSAATAMNFVVATPLLLALVAATGGLGPGWPAAWPSGWYLYLGGVLGVLIVMIIVLVVGVLGVLRTNLAMIGGQLAGAILLDAVLPGGAGPSGPVVAGALLTVAAVALAGRARAP